jgi:hypothetical protein
MAATDELPGEAYELLSLSPYPRNNTLHFSFPSPPWLTKRRNDKALP